MKELQKTRFAQRWTYPDYSRSNRVLNVGKPENLTDELMARMQARMIHNTPKPSEEGNWDGNGYEEIDGHLYQTWVQV
jgi:hypothetical protein